MADLHGDFIDDDLRFSLVEICERCGLQSEELIEMVSYGIVEPAEGRAREQWRFHAIAIRRVQKARRLQQDLGVNLPGVSLALDLLEEVERLRVQLRRMQ